MDLILVAVISLGAIGLIAAVIFMMIHFSLHIIIQLHCLSSYSEGLS